ncbi:hypothetical protein Ndes2526A_g07668 [Nannochloris sp. 'desiccata']|nr:hypothetical protein KSW81_002429 [Chlorella desiccata (nom. nud.)]
MSSSEVAGWLTSAIISCQPIDHQCLEAINAFLPGVLSVAVAFPVIFPDQEYHVLQTCFNLDLDKQPCTGRSAVFSGLEALLAKTVYGTGKALLCPASKCATFADVKNLLKDAPCSSAACIPLLQQFPSSEDTKSSTITSPSSTRPFGSLCISFQHDTIPKETVAAAHSLSRALAYGHGKVLQGHAETIINCLGASMHSIPEDDLDSEEYDVEDGEEFSDLSEADFDDEASCSRPTTMDSPTAMRMPLTTTTTPSQTFWMTFKDPTLEKAYLEWFARHMRPLDPASTMLACIFFCTMGFSRTSSMARNHPLPWVSGWTALIPMLFCVLPATNHIYMAHRELFLLIFHVSSLGWHVATANTTKYLGDATFLLYSNPKACFIWQFANLVMFQLRWKYAVAIALTMFVGDSILLVPGLCRLFQHHSSGTTNGVVAVAVAVSRCEKETLLYGAAQLFAVLVVLHVNECRTRKLFLNSLETKQQQQQGSSSWRSGSTLQACLGSMKEKVV